MGEVTGFVGCDGKVLVLRRVHVRYRLRVGTEHRETVERALAVHADSCPVARSIRGAIEVTTDVVFEA